MATRGPNWSEAEVTYLLAHSDEMASARVAAIPVARRSRSSTWPRSALIGAFPFCGHDYRDVGARLIGGGGLALVPRHLMLSSLYETRNLCPQAHGTALELGPGEPKRQRAVECVQRLMQSVLIRQRCSAHEPVQPDV